MPGDSPNARQHVFDAVVEFGAQQVLALFSLLAPGDIAGQALDAHKAAGRVEFRSRGFLEPHLPAVWANETKGERGGRTVDAWPVIVRLEAREVVRMNPREELGGGESLLWAQPQDLASLVAAPRHPPDRIALASPHPPRAPRLPP